MSDTIYPGGPVMIRIDGSKIRQIREQKGLTQLYIATVVEVTTDTVSRWENKRYPSIKKENGLKLAQALEVDLDHILESVEPNELVHEKNPQLDHSEIENISQNSKETLKPHSFLNSRWKRSFLFLFLVFIVLAIYLFHLYISSNNVSSDISISRTLPSHFISGRPLPVFLHISTASQDTISIILRENLPPGTKVNSTTPAASNKNKKDHSIQWLKKVTGPTVFIYTLNSIVRFEGSLHFDGILKIGSKSGEEIAISGDNTSTATLFHWADTNRDNRISDEEILVVYDLVNANEETGIDMDLLEEIWLGEGYIWHPGEKTFSILE